MSIFSNKSRALFHIYLSVEGINLHGVQVFNEVRVDGGVRWWRGNNNGLSVRSIDVNKERVLLGGRIGVDVFFVVFVDTGV